MRDDAKAALTLKSEPPRLVPCQITALAPLTVTLNGTSMPASQITGATYALGHAMALWAPPAMPIIIPVS